MRGPLVTVVAWAFAFPLGCVVGWHVGVAVGAVVAGPWLAYGGERYRWLAWVIDAVGALCAAGLGFLLRWNFLRLTRR